jgi:DNA polymerase-3 subunit delta
VSFLDFQQFIRGIDSGQTAPIYFLFGEEIYFIDGFIKKVIDACTDPATRPFNCDVLLSEQIDGDSVVTMASSFPMMAEKRVVILKSIQKLSSSDRKRLLTYVESPLKSTCLVLTANDIDRRNRFYSTLIQNSQWAECKSLYANQAVDWIVDTLRKQNITISHEGAVYLTEQVGTSLWHLHNEIEKLLVCNWGKKTLGIEEVTGLIGSSRQYNSWELADAIGKRELGSAMRILKHMLEEGQSPIGLIVSLSQRVSLLMKILSLLNRRVSRPEILKTMALRPYFADLYLKQAQRFSMNELESAQRMLLFTDGAIKTGLQKPVMAMTLLIYAIVRHPSAGVYGDLLSSE